jgi:HEAT repeat protein
MSQPGVSDARGSRVVLEPPSDLVILARVEQGAVTRLRTFSPDCDIDGGGMQIVWLENVPAAASIAWLATLVDGAGDRERDNRVIRPAVAALALHPDRPALAALIAWARQDPRREVRNQALFWLSQRAGQEAAAAITDALQNDPETEVKRRAVFALSQLPKDEGIPLLIQVAKTNGNPDVRKQAMFWLGQSHDPRAVMFFEEVLRAK